MRQTGTAPSPFMVRTGAVAVTSGLWRRCASGSRAAPSVRHARNLVETMCPKLAQEILPSCKDPHECFLDRLLAQPVTIAYRIECRVVRALNPGGPEPPEPATLCFRLVQGREAMGTGWPVSEGGVAHIKPALCSNRT